jgi:hypothetical protein
MSFRNRLGEKSANPDENTGKRRVIVIDLGLPWSSRRSNHHANWPTAAVRSNAGRHGGHYTHHSADMRSRGWRNRG